ncbi:MAG: GGDEF domain-containing protein [Epsilonproteobacteria bacterium]|nr:GGDEF domain-containing protein [Campylobacterota bacterium]
MPPALRGKSRRKISSKEISDVDLILDEGNKNQSSDLDQFAKTVLQRIIDDDLPPTPNNYSLYFDRLLDEQNEAFKKQVHSLLELEESNDAENTIVLEQNLKQGFGAIRNLLAVTANLYKNMSVIEKILDKRKKELEDVGDNVGTIQIAESIKTDINKLNTILKKQTSQMKQFYEETGSIVKKVEQESIFDDRFGVYNKRYLLAKMEKEQELIKEFGHKSSLIMIELSKELKAAIHNEKVITLMTRTVARLLLKTSRRSDIIAHYGKGIFVMLLKHTDIENAKKASERLCDLVANSNFFLADKEIQLKVAIGITEIDLESSVEETIVYAMEAIDKAYEDEGCFAVVVRNDRDGLE